VSKDENAFAKSGPKINSAHSVSMPQQAVDAVGRRVKDSYGKLLQEPVPENLLKLLDQLDASASSKKTEPDDRGSGEGGGEHGS
jgi:hypothetical protein